MLDSEWIGSVRYVGRRLFVWPYQRLVRGFDDRELWNLDATISDFVLPRLIAFRNLHQSGCPNEVVAIAGRDDDGDIKCAMDVWLEILDDMIYFHEQISAVGVPDDSGRYYRGKEYWGKYYDGLWD